MRSSVLTAGAAAFAMGIGVGAVGEGGRSAGEVSGNHTVAAVTAGHPWHSGFDFSRPDVVATGLEVPWGLAFLPDGDALVAERNSGWILRVRPGRPPQRVMQVPGVSAIGESGLLGLAVSPYDRRDPYVYAYYTTSTDNRIVRFRLSAPKTPQPILTGLSRAAVHDGGRLAFGPDGMLYAGTGDAGQAAVAQDPQNRNGKILRMSPDGTPPRDNPFPGSVVYSIGHRNVQGLAFDRRGRLYATELGAIIADEANLIVRAGNYGWPVVEGRAGDPRFRDPLITWTPAEASPSGAAIADRTLFVAALRGRRLWTVPINNDGTLGAAVPELVNVYGRLRTVAVAPDGSLWVATSNRDGRGTPTPTDDRILRFRPVPHCALD